MRERERENLEPFKENAKDFRHNLLANSQFYTNLKRLGNSRSLLSCHGGSFSRGSLTRVVDSCR